MIYDMVVIVAATTAIIRQIVLFSHHHPGLKPLDSAAYTWPLVYRCNISSLHYPSSGLKPEVIKDFLLNSLHDGYFFLILLSSAFFKINFKKNLSGTLSECQTVLIQIRTDILSVLVWVQTVSAYHKSQR